MIPGSKENHPSFWKSFGFAVQGFRFAYATERNIKVMLGGFVFAIAAGLIIGIDAVRWAIVLVCCGAVLCAELLNTAIETVVDLVSPEIPPACGPRQGHSGRGRLGALHVRWPYGPHRLRLGYRREVPLSRGSAPPDHLKESHV